MAFTGVTNAYKDHPSQQHVGLQIAVFSLQKDVTGPDARFKPTLPESTCIVFDFRGFKLKAWLRENVINNFQGSVISLLQKKPQ